MANDRRAFFARWTNGTPCPPCTPRVRAFALCLVCPPYVLLRATLIKVDRYVRQGRGKEDASCLDRVGVKRELFLGRLIPWVPVSHYETSEASACSLYRLDPARLLCIPS